MRERILDLALGALNAERAREVQRHLDTCDSCRRYAQALAEQGESLAVLGRQVQADMDARRCRTIEALQGVAPARPRVLPSLGRFARAAVAAVLVLAAGIIIGRLSSPESIDVEQLRADLQASIVASLQPAVRQAVLSDVDRRLEAALAARDERIATELVELLRQDLRVIAAELTTGSERLVDERFADVVQLIEAARQTDRRQVARALEQIRTQAGMGFLRLATLTEGRPAARQDQ
jgi:anti-sigma factor RsiW